VVTHGGIWLGQELLQHLIGAGRQLVKAPSASVESALQLLTPRERDVAQQAAIGLSNKEIARILNITERTVKAHLSASFERLGVKDRLQLALVLNK
jgi:DNA-binding NarL/FixJ family response regulator